MKDIKETKHTIYISTGIRENKCQLCNFKFNEYTKLTEKINHYIKEHNYVILHVGQQTGRELSTDEPYQDTVAILAID